MKRMTLKEMRQIRPKSEGFVGLFHEKLDEVFEMLKPAIEAFVTDWIEGLGLRVDGIPTISQHEQARWITIEFATTSGMNVGSACITFIEQGSSKPTKVDVNVVDCIGLMSSDEVRADFTSKLYEMLRVLVKGRSTD